MLISWNLLFSFAMLKVTWNLYSKEYLNDFKNMSLVDFREHNYVDFLERFIIFFSTGNC